MDLYPNQASAVTDVLAERLGDFEFGELGTLTESLCRLAQCNPEGTWVAIGKCLLDERRFFPISFMADELASAINCIPANTVVSWIEEDPDRRAVLALSCFPAALYDKDGKPTVAREIVAKYGDQKSVQGEMLGKARGFSWIGSLVDYYDRKIAELETYREREQNPYVLTYIDRTISEFRSERDKERISEERIGW